MIVVIDVAKGVEEQTEKLVEVCRMRKTPVIVFINKMDRPGKEAFDLLDEVEQKLMLKAVPLSWPIGMGDRFQGVYNLYEERIVLFRPDNKQGRPEETIEFTDLEDPELDKLIGIDAAVELREEIEMIRGVYPKFDREVYLKGDVSPVFFGSAVNNFGVKRIAGLLRPHCTCTPAQAHRGTGR